MKKIGEILIENGVISEDQLRIALTMQERENIIQLGMVLILLDYITPEQLLKCLDQQKKDTCKEKIKQGGCDGRNY